jgi:N6-adenosine-specific RNA methylase IME4
MESRSMLMAMEQPRDLMLVSEARRFLAEACSIDTVKEVIDKAEAVRMYCKKAGEGLEAQNAAAEIRLLAIRRAGELLQTDLLRGRPRKGSTQEPFLTLDDVGINKQQSHRWQAIASLDEQKFLDYIEQTKEAGKELTAVGASKLAKKSTNRTEQVDPVSYGFISDLHQFVEKGVKFSTVYADPPWQYSNKATRSNVESEYKSTMTVDEICAEPVSQIVADNAHLHLWTTNAFLFDAKRVMEAWGFEYKSCFIWIKPQMGIGNYWRVSHEFMLLGVRGAMTFADHSQMSWGAFDRTKHSRKPREVRAIIEKVSPGPYLEMYGREVLETPWTVYGNDPDPDRPMCR